MRFIRQKSLCLTNCLSQLLLYKLLSTFHSLVIVVGSIVLQSGTLTPEPTPTPFLGHIFYGRNYTLKIFDHDLPLPSGNDNADDNFHVLH